MKKCSKDSEILVAWSLFTTSGSRLYTLDISKSTNYCNNLKYHESIPNRLEFLTEPIKKFNELNFRNSLFVFLAIFFEKKPLVLEPKIDNFPIFYLLKCLNQFFTADYRETIDEFHEYLAKSQKRIDCKVVNIERLLDWTKDLFCYFEHVLPAGLDSLNSLFSECSIEQLPDYSLEQKPLLFGLEEMNSKQNFYLNLRTCGEEYQLSCVSYKVDGVAVFADILYEDKWLTFDNNSCRLVPNASVERCLATRVELIYALKCK
jgi:hypothetical protein